MLSLSQETYEHPTQEDSRASFAYCRVDIRYSISSRIRLKILVCRTYVGVAVLPLAIIYLKVACVLIVLILALSKTFPVQSLSYPSRLAVRRKVDIGLHSGKK